MAAYIIPSADPHISEYVPDRYKCVEFVSGFTGSAGTLIITSGFAGLWTDSRYFVQAEEQLEGSGFELVKLKSQHALEYIGWLSAHVPKGAVVAFDGRLVSVQLAESLEEGLGRAGIGLETGRDYLEAVWENRPALPEEKAFLLDEKTTGKPVAAKLSTLREALKERDAGWHLISSLDDIAWLFNIRGRDVKCNPVVLSFALIGLEKAFLFIHPDKLTAEEKKRLQESGVELLPYQAVEQALKDIPAGAKILIDPKKNCHALYRLIPPEVGRIKDTNPTTWFKAVKNETEITHVRETMIKDGVALTRFFKWLEEHAESGKLTEISAGEQLYRFRAGQEGFTGESFDTIAGYKAHGALPHYKATPESDAELKAEGLFLLDSGGQYNSGTTDVTRVVSLGNIKEEETDDYTFVLKGMIDGSTARFPRGTRGYQIDAITRKPLWDAARNYGHGTGHGVGFFLNVHEGPQVFNPSNQPVNIKPGMITSVEPGIYRPGRYGIRIENLVLCTEDEANEFDEFCTFETLTICYIDTSLVKKELLERRQVSWLNLYNRQVYEKLSPHLTEEEQSWLAGKTQPI